MWVDSNASLTESDNTYSDNATTSALFFNCTGLLIIMVALPMSFIGVLLALIIAGKNFNLFTMMGIILLMGMVGKNAVLLVDFANQQLRKGSSVTEALVLAGEKRLRPILCVAAYRASGGGGEGSEARRIAGAPVEPAELPSALSRACAHALSTGQNPRPGFARSTVRRVEATSAAMAATWRRGPR